MSLSNLIVPSSWASTANAFSDAAHLATRELALKLELIAPNAAHRFDASKFALLSGFAYPNATLDRFKVCNDWHSWLFFFDDQSDEQAELGHKNGYHEARWVKSKKGHMARLAIPESTV